MNIYLKINNNPVVKLYELKTNNEVAIDRPLEVVGQRIWDKQSVVEAFAAALTCDEEAITVSRTHSDPSADSYYVAARVFTVDWLETVDGTVATLDDKERYSMGLCNLYRAVATLSSADMSVDEECVAEALDEILGAEDA